MQMAFFWRIIRGNSSNKGKLEGSRSSQESAMMKELCSLFLRPTSRECSVCYLERRTDGCTYRTDAALRTYLTEFFLINITDAELDNYLRCTPRIPLRVRHSTRAPKMRLPQNSNASLLFLVILHSKCHGASSWTAYRGSRILGHTVSCTPFPPYLCKLLSFPTDPHSRRFSHSKQASEVAAYPRFGTLV